MGQWLLRRLRAGSDKRSRASRGFTVAELLIGATVGALLLTGLLYMVTEMIRIERTETARGETEREMAQALDFIASELREAVLVYDRKCLGGTGEGGGTTCPGLRLPRNTVLAFWKREDLPDLNLLNIAPQNLGEYAVLDWFARRCSSAVNQQVRQDCEQVANLTRTQYKLVVYLLCANQYRPGNGTNDDCPWAGEASESSRGPARIERGHFAQYNWEGLNQDQENPPNVKQFNRLAGLDPLQGPTWPNTIPAPNPNSRWNSQGVPNTETATLVANVDWQRTRINIPCPPGYVSSTGINSDTGFPSFYACVRERVGAETGFVQDVYIYLRGNAAERAGLREIEQNTNQYRPAVETQVRTRGTYNRQPT